MYKTNDFGVCEVCDEELIPIWFTEEETRVADGIMYRTGRKRRAVSHLTCPSCLRNFCVDDSFDGAWR